MDDHTRRMAENAERVKAYLEQRISGAAVKYDLSPTSNLANTEDAVVFTIVTDRKYTVLMARELLFLIDPKLDALLRGNALAEAIQNLKAGEVYLVPWRGEGRPVKS